MSGGERSMVLEVGVGIIFPTALVFSLFLLFAGHNAPGGGFVGGLVAGAALVLKFVDGGVDAVRRVLPFAPQSILGTGLTISALTAVGGWIGGGQLLESTKVSLDVPLIGAIKATTALPFDIGVYLVVIGLVLGLLRAMGAGERA